MKGIKYPNPIIYYYGDKLDQYAVPISYPGVMQDTYYINPYGEILSMYGKYPRMLQPSADKNGYYKVGLRTEDGGRTYAYIHRLVAYEFIKNPFPGVYNIVNHINADHTKNDYLNLEWCDDDLNREHAKRNKLFKRLENHPYSIHSNETVREICEMLQAGLTEAEIRQYYGITKSSNRQLYTLINHVHNRQSWRDISDEYDF